MKRGICFAVHSVWLPDPAGVQHFYDTLGRPARCGRAWPFVQGRYVVEGRAQPKCEACTKAGAS